MAKDESSAFQAWIEAGRPIPFATWKKQWEKQRPQIAPITPYAKEKYPGELPKGVTVAPEAEHEKVLRAMRESQRVAAKAKAEGEQIGGMPVRWGTISEGGWIYNVGYDKNGNIVSREPLGRTETITPETISPYQQEQLRLQEQAGWITPYQQAQMDLQRWQTEQQMGAEQAQQQAMLGWYQQQATMQQAESERQERARLAAQPISWLQYASYTGQTPVVQPWMQPLMGGYQTGQAIPGWSASGGSAMPELTRPSAQYQARMGPTALQNLAGYEQYRTGATPEETAFRLGSTAPPSGRRSALRWMR